MPVCERRQRNGENGSENFHNDGSEWTYENNRTIACKSVVKHSIPPRPRVWTKLVYSLALRPLESKGSTKMTILEQDTMRAITRIPKELEKIKEAISFITIVLIALSGKGKIEIDNDITKAIEIIKNKG